MELSGLITKMVIFLALMLVGYVAVRKGICDEKFSKSLSWFVMNVFLSCTIINSVISDPPELSGSQLWYTIILLSIVIALVLFVGIISVNAVKLGDDNRALSELLCGVSNNVFVGMPLIQSLYGSEGLLYTALSCIPYNVFLYTVGVWRLKKGREDSAVHIKDMLTTPLYATVLALTIFTFNIPVPNMLCELISTAADATMPLSMIVIGATLGSVSLVDAFKEKRMYFISFIRLILTPALTLLLLSRLTDNTVLLSTSVIISACPSAVNVSVLALQYGHDASYSSKGVLVTTLLSMITLPIWAMILS